MRTPRARQGGASSWPAGRRIATLPLLVALVAGCANTEPVRRPEGEVAFHSGTATGESGTHVVEGPALQRPGVLVPAYEPVWQATWVDKTKEHPVVEGATAGMMTGLAIFSVAPAALMFWPAAAGIMVGATAMGMIGASQGWQAKEANPLMGPPDRQVIAEATVRLKPDQVFRQSMAQALSERTRSRLPIVISQQTWGPDTAGSDHLAEARDRGLDGLFEFTLEGIGLAVGEESDMFGVVAQVRVRALDLRDGTVRYERVLSYGPGLPVVGMRKPDIHSLDMLAMNEGMVYRHLAQETLRRMADLLAQDPALPLPR